LTLPSESNATATCCRVCYFDDTTFRRFLATPKTWDGRTVQRKQCPRRRPFGLQPGERGDWGGFCGGGRRPPPQKPFSPLSCRQRRAGEGRAYKCRFLPEGPDVNIRAERAKPCGLKIQPRMPRPKGGFALLAR